MTDNNYKKIDNNNIKFNSLKTNKSCHYLLEH